MIIYKQYARRSIEGYRSPYRKESGDPFEYVSIQEVQPSLVLATLAQSIDPSTDATIASVPADELFQQYREYAGDAFSPESWHVVHHGGRPVGVAFAQRFHDLLTAGGLFHVGLTEEYRGKGYGKVLLAHGMEVLAKQGAVEYIGSTDATNYPMIFTFIDCGFALTSCYKIEYTSGGSQELLEKLPSVTPPRRPESHASR